MLTKQELITDIQAEIGEASAESVDLTDYLTSVESCETAETMKGHLLEAKQAAESILNMINDSLGRLAERPWYIKDDCDTMHGPYTDKSDAEADADRIDGIVVQS